MREPSAVMLALGAEDYAFVIPNPEQQARIAMLRNKVRVEFDFLLEKFADAELNARKLLPQGSRRARDGQSF